MTTPGSRWTRMADVNVEVLPTEEVLALFEMVFGRLGPVSKRRIIETARLRGAGSEPARR